MTMTRLRFEAQFDSRTLAYLPGFIHAAQPLVIVVGDAANTPAGHSLLMTLTNLVARAHRRVTYVGKLDGPLLCRSPFGVQTLVDATIGLARSINPFIELDVTTIAPARSLLTIGVGVDNKARVDLALGCDGWLALLGPDARVGTDQTSVWGAGLAACLGANAAIHRVLGTREKPVGTFSAWDYVRPSTVQGPAMDGPIDVGRVLQVGAGAVGCALDYFLSFFGVAGPWIIVDGDEVDVSNLNRQLLFIARDAGFPELPSANKAERAARLLDAEARFSPCWFGEDEAVVERDYDVVLALANDRGVRSFLQGRQPTVLLHATTSPNWQAQLHRHVAGRDDCIDCRLPAESPHFACATEVVQAAGGERFDAAVPPLSAVAGLLLAAELVRLQSAVLVGDEPNFTAVELFTEVPTVQRKIRRCRAGCGVRRPVTLRQVIDAHSRWVQLDGEALQRNDV